MSDDERDIDIESDVSYAILLTNVTQIAMHFAQFLNCFVRMISTQMEGISREMQSRSIQVR